ncbi:hypothetical protein STFE110948_02090 [Streptobacillus felis]|uniref:Uncharacterized protein n=1 Tax=Streptobacillus felis TaxID=1384509 RepID=A0A7Z0PGA3_9FUSO|nr:hypothetical protein [Streptobacillus felis]NYV27535.1 hypothetical protein [Streptobacillus felis]
MNKKNLVIIISVLMLVPLFLNLFNDIYPRIDIIIYSVLVVLLGILNISKLNVLENSNVVRLNNIDYIRYFVIVLSIFLTFYYLLVFKTLNLNGYILYMLSFVIDGENYSYNKDFFYYKKLKILFNDISSVGEIQKGIMAENFVVTLKNGRKVKIGSFNREDLEKMREILRKKR